MQPETLYVIGAASLVVLEVIWFVFIAELILHQTFNQNPLLKKFHTLVAVAAILITLYGMVKYSLLAYMLGYVSGK